MNLWFAGMTLFLIWMTAGWMYIKHRTLRSVWWQLVLLGVSTGAFWVGTGTAEFWVILLTSIIIGGCLLLAALNSYNKLYANIKGYDAVGEQRRPKPFGNGYWH